jgi:hypothetical protein
MRPGPEGPGLSQPGGDEPADLYRVLGVDAGAARPDIVRAYRRLARASHPDAHPGDPAAEARFRLVTLAYQVLADPRRRAAYDRAHPGAGRPPGHQQGGAGPPQGGAGQQPWHTPGLQAWRRAGQGGEGQPIPVRRTGPGGTRPQGHPGWPPLWAGPVLTGPPGRADVTAGAGWLVPDPWEAPDPPPGPWLIPGSWAVPDWWSWWA